MGEVEKAVQESNSQIAKFELKQFPWKVEQLKAALRLSTIQRFK